MLKKISEFLARLLQILKKQTPIPHFSAVVSDCKKSSIKQYFKSCDVCDLINLVGSLFLLCCSIMLFMMFMQIMSVL